MIRIKFLFIFFLVQFQVCSVEFFPTDDRYLQQILNLKQREWTRDGITTLVTLLKDEKQTNKGFFRKKELKPILNENILNSHIEFVKKINCVDIWDISHKKLISQINKKD